MTTYAGPYRDFTIPEKREVIHTDGLRFPWREDPAGYFLVRTDGDRIRVGFLEDDVMTLELQGSDPYNIIKEIAKRDLINKEHMGYIAAEIVRAKQAIDTNETFVQR